MARKLTVWLSDDTPAVDLLTALLTLNVQLRRDQSGELVAGTPPPRNPAAAIRAKAAWPPHRSAPRASAQRRAT